MNTLEEILSETKKVQIGDHVLIGGTIGPVTKIEGSSIFVDLIFTNPLGGSIKETHKLESKQILKFWDHLKAWESDVEVLTLAESGKSKRLTRA